MSLWKGEHKDETETIVCPEVPKDSKALCYCLFLCYTYMHKIGWV